MVVTHLENSLHIGSLQKHFLFNIKNGVRLWVQMNRLLAYGNILLDIPKSCRIKGNSLICRIPIHCSMPRIPFPSLMSVMSSPLKTYVVSVDSINYNKSKVPCILPECPLGPVPLLLRTTGLETSLPLSGVVSGLFRPYRKLCLSKSLSTLTFNKPKSHEAMTGFFFFNSQEAIQLYTDTQVRLARTSLASSNKPTQTCVHLHTKEEFTRLTWKHKCGADSKTTGSKNSSQVLKTPFFLPTFFLSFFSLYIFFSLPLSLSLSLSVG